MKAANQLTWRWGNEPGLSGRAQCHHTHPYKWRSEAGKRVKSEGVWERLSWHCWFENLRSHGGLWKLEEVTKRSPFQPPETNQVLLVP